MLTLYVSIPATCTGDVRSLSVSLKHKQRMSSVHSNVVGRRGGGGRGKRVCVPLGVGGFFPLFLLLGVGGVGNVFDVDGREKF